MAATNEAWKNVYVKGLRGPGDLCEIGKQPLSFFYAVSNSYFEDEKGFFDQVEMNPTNFIIIPGPLRTVCIVHNVFNLDGEGSLGRGL
jgi:hypothetical protein